MSNAANVRKHKVELNDYDFQRDIKIRLLLSKLTDIEKSILEEIMDGSVKFSVKQLSETLSLKPDAIIPFIKKLEELDFHKMQSDQLTINKDMRKYFAYELNKFSSHFEPSICHVQTLLNKVPIHNLPHWYAISRSADNIFEAIIEKYFHTPKCYAKHLEELSVENPYIYKLYEAILKSDNYCLDVEKIMRQFKLNHQEFEVLMLEFEYNFCGSLCYRRKGIKWVECASLYQEWKEYLQIKSEQSPISLKAEKIKNKTPNEFYFIDELNRLLDWINENPSLKSAEEHFLHFSDLLECALNLHLVTRDKSRLSLVKENLKTWQRKTKPEQASALYRMILGYSRTVPSKINCSEKDLRAIEKELKTVTRQGWISLESFMNSLTAPIREHSPIELHRKGKKWRYKMPEYTDSDKKLIQEIIERYLWMPGILLKGTQGKIHCFSITPFGRITLGD